MTPELFPGEPTVRKQYHFRPSRRGYYAWDVDRLIELTKGFERRQVDVESIRELDQAFWFSGKNDRPTCRAIVDRMRLIDEADWSHPIILSSDGRVMDGMHRMAKALFEGRETIEAVRFVEDPEPDFEDVEPDELLY